MTLWKTPDIKPDVFRSHHIIVDYEARGHTEPMLSTEYAERTADRYVNRWCYLDELIAAADRLQPVVGTALISIRTAANLDGEKAKRYADAKIDLIKQLTKGE